MKLPSILHPTQTLRGLRTAALAALTVALLTAGSAPASVTYGNATALPSSALSSQDYLLGFRVTVTSAGTLDAFGADFRDAGGLASFGLYAADGGGGEPGTLVAQTGSFAVAGPRVAETPPTAAVTLAAGDYWIMAVYSVDTLVGFEFSGSGADVTDYRSLSFTGSLPASFGSATSYGGYKTGYYIRVTTEANTVLYQKGDMVPGVSGATFTSVGVPAINASGTVAFLGKWTGTSGSSSGILVNGAVVAQLGDEVPTGSGVRLHGLKDPVLDDAGHVAFPANFSGAAIGTATYTGVVSNAPGGTLAIVAQQGYAATDAPAGALWKSFASVAAPGGGRGVIFLATMAGGGLTSTTDAGVWSADSAGVLHLVLQEGTTVIGGKTVKNFAVLKAVSGTPGQTHAFNNAAELVAKVTFMDGYTGVVHLALP